MTPHRTYATPEEVLGATELPRARKIEILRQWEYDEREVAVAVEEGMPGAEPVLLRRIALALERLGAGPDPGRTAPTKQGG